jgi:hypothetical protein
MIIVNEKYIYDLLIQADLYRLIALGFDVMDWDNQSLFFDNLEDFLSTDFKSISIFDFYESEIKLLEEVKHYKNIPLEGEYHRLFDIQNGIPFSEASFTKIEKGNIIGDVSSFYKAVNFPYKTEKVGSPDTFIKETGFISFLFLKEFALLNDETLLEEEKKEIQEVLKDFRYKFFNEHYLTWVPDFINILFETTENRFYLNLGKVLQKLIEKIH